MAVVPRVTCDSYKDVPSRHPSENDLLKGVSSAIASFRGGLHDRKLLHLHLVTEQGKSGRPGHFTPITLGDLGWMYLPVYCPAGKGRVSRGLRGHLISLWSSMMNWPRLCWVHITGGFLPLPNLAYSPFPSLIKNLPTKCTVIVCFWKT